MIEIRYCDRLHNIPIKDADFVIISDNDITMSYIDVPITEAFDDFFEEYTNEKGELSDSITEDMLIDYISNELLRRGYTHDDFHIYKKVI